MWATMCVQAARLLFLCWVVAVVAVVVELVVVVVGNGEEWSRESLVGQPRFSFLPWSGGGSHVDELYEVTLLP